MPHTESAKRPDVEMVTAAVVDGTVTVGDIGDIANGDRPVHHGRNHHLDVSPFCAVGIGHPSSLRAV